MQLDNKMHFVQLIPVNRITGSLHHRTISLLLIAVNRFQKLRHRTSWSSLLVHVPWNKSIIEKASTQPVRRQYWFSCIHAGSRRPCKYLRTRRIENHFSVFCSLLVYSYSSLAIFVFFSVSAFVPPIIVDSSLSSMNKHDKRKIYLLNPQIEIHIRLFFRFRIGFGPTIDFHKALKTYFSRHSIRTCNRFCASFRASRAKRWNIETSKCFFLFFFVLYAIAGSMWNLVTAVL